MHADGDWYTSTMDVLNNLFDPIVPGGFLQIDVRRLADPQDGCQAIHVEIAVVSFYPAIANALSPRLYAATQSAIHVLVTHAFLRSLARLDLAESRTGRFRGDDGSGQ